MLSLVYMLLWVCCDLWRCWLIVFALESPVSSILWFLVVGVVGPLVVVCALYCLQSAGRL